MKIQFFLIYAFVVLVFIPLKTSAQYKDFSLSANYFPSLNPHRDFGLQANMHFGDERARLNLGGEFRTALWGNQLTSQLGYLRLVKNGNLSFGAGGDLNLGVALFVNRPMLVIGTTGYLMVQQTIGKRLFARSTLGLRYANCPGYSDYSQFSNTLEADFRLGMGVRLGKELE
ncbi:MAG: hypothetical protein KDC92_04565 [Bacteroidetes bacterium]|nr:hypothetical protein [Bacteroidota bacterium]